MADEKEVFISKSDTISFRIPFELIKEFGEDVRIVIGPHTLGIIPPERFVPEILKGARNDFDIVITPRHR